ncbi:MAG: hypothetical protein H0X66_08575 [Verrucomicrobia bacterium]|nr:hypothetical protein [Verrucomicrobiota bacterium]
MVVGWKTGKPKELCQKADVYLATGDPGIAIWDPQVQKGWPEGSPGMPGCDFKRVRIRVPLSPGDRQDALSYTGGEAA